MLSKTCKICGAHNEAEAKECYKCGTPFDSDSVIIEKKEKKIDKEEISNKTAAIEKDQEDFKKSSLLDFVDSILYAGKNILSGNNNESKKEKNNKAKQTENKKDTEKQELENKTQNESKVLIDKTDVILQQGKELVRDLSDEPAEIETNNSVENPKESLSLIDQADEILKRN